MGHFNAACSISNLTIHPGDSVLFIPLLPNLSASSNREHLVGVNSMLIYSNCYFNPFCLPIEGKYDHYGNIEEIKKNANTKAIEKFFGITIEEFMECVNSGREWNDYFSGIHNIYAKSPKLLSDHNIIFNENYLKNIGFVKNKQNEYSFQEFPYSVLVKSKNKNEDSNFEIRNLQGDVVYNSAEMRDNKSKILEEFYKLTGWFLGIEAKNQKKIETLKNLSGMFILKGIYYDLAKNNKSYSYSKDRNVVVSTGYLTESVLTDLGFKVIKQKITSPDFPDRTAVLYGKKGSTAQVAYEALGSIVLWKTGKKNKKETVYSVKEFGTLWEKVTEDILDLSKFDKIYQMDLAFDYYQKELIKAEKETKKVKLEDLPPNVQKLLIKMSKYHFGNDHLMGFFKDWKFFDDLYLESIRKGKLKEDFRWWVLFYLSMHSNNRFFFPAMNGEQDGNDEESKVLLEASLKVVNQRLKQANEESDDNN
jgi:hypothetical protein